MKPDTDRDLRKARAKAARAAAEVARLEQQKAAEEEATKVPSNRELHVDFVRSLNEQDTSLLSDAAHRGNLDGAMRPQ